MASLTQFESALISERVKAGMARTKSMFGACSKAQDKRVSRPRLNGSLQQKIKELYTHH